MRSKAASSGSPNPSGADGLAKAQVEDPPAALQPEAVRVIAGELQSRIACPRTGLLPVGLEQLGVPVGRGELHPPERGEE